VERQVSRSIWIVLLLSAGAARAEVWEALGEDASGFAAVDSGGGHLRALGGMVIGQGGHFDLPAQHLSPGEYKLRATWNDPTDAAQITAIVSDESHRVLYSGPVAALRVRVSRPSLVSVVLRNGPARAVLVTNLALLVRRARAPLQIVLYVPDACAFFPADYPTAAWAQYAPQGTFHSDVWASGDNTWSFTKTMFLWDTPDHAAMPSLVRRQAIPTAVVADNFYLLQYVDRRLFDYMWIRDVAPTSDQEIDHRALEWVRQHRDEDFVLYTHMLSDHDTGHRLSTDTRVRSAVDALRAVAPGALFLIVPDHGAMRDHAWYPNDAAGGQGWGLYTDTEHVPLLAMGAGLEKGVTCDRRWSMFELRDRLARVSRSGLGPLRELLACRVPAVTEVMTEGFKDQWAITDGKFHYVRYQPGVPYPAYSMLSHQLSRDKFLKEEALFADAQNVRPVAGDYVEVLLRLRLRARETLQKLGIVRGAPRRLRLFWLSKSCQAPAGAIRLRAGGGMRLSENSGAVAQAAPRGELSVELQAPFCYREASVDLDTDVEQLEISLLGSDLFLGGGYLRRREHVTLTGANAFDTLAEWRGAGYGEVFVQNHARPGLYLFIEAREAQPAAAPVAKKPGSGSSVNASPEEVRRMMRSWGYMRESEISDLQ
jgi:hypothetical protein